MKGVFAWASLINNLPITHINDQNAPEMKTISVATKRIGGPAPIRVGISRGICAETVENFSEEGQGYFQGTAYIGYTGFGNSIQI